MVSRSHSRCDYESASEGSSTALRSAAAGFSNLARRTGVFKNSLAACCLVAASARFLSSLNQFDLVAFGRVDESKAAIFLVRRSVRVFQSMLREMLAEFLQALDLKREMGEVGLQIGRAHV